MLGGQYLLENGWNDSDEDDKKDDSDFVNSEDNEDESAEDYDDDEQDSTDSEEEEGNQSNLREKRNQENHVETRVLSIAQDLVYSVSVGKECGHQNTSVLVAAFIRRRALRNWCKCFIMLVI